MTGGTCVIAVSLVMTACAVQAQPDVILYGVSNIGLESAGASNVRAAPRLVSNSSALGLRGSEDLGDGRKAFFQIEGSLDMDSGVGWLADRDTFAGLRGRFGRIKAGNITAPMRGMGGRINFVPGSTSIANNIGIMTTINGQPTGLNSRMQNSLRYDTPGTPGGNGMRCSVIWAPGEKKPLGQNNTSYGAGLTYRNGSFQLDYAYERRRAQQVLAVGDSDDTGHRVAARLRIGAMVFGAAWDSTASRGDFVSGATTGAGWIARRSWSVSAMRSVGNQDLAIHYSTALDLHCNGVASAGQCDVSRRGDSGARQLSLFYQYHLSPRTALQAYFSRIINEPSAMYDFDIEPVVPFASRTGGAALSGAGVGIRHEF